MFVLKRIIGDSRFQAWVLKPGVKIGSQTIKRGAAISSRVGDLDECCDIMIQLFAAFSTQSGIRGPAQDWSRQIGLHRPPEIPIEANITPALLWKIRLLEDYAHLKSKTNKKQVLFSDGYNLHQRRKIPLSTMNAFQIIVDKVLSAHNGNLHHAFLAIAMEADGPRGQPSKGHPWANFSHLVGPWVAREGWLKMQEELLA